MPKKPKFYDPYRYKYMNVLYSWGEGRRYYKEKSTKRMDVLSDQEQKVIADQIAEANSIKQQISDQDAYNAEAVRIVKKYTSILKPLSAEYVAEFLIANNIARRGEVLHGSNAMNTLKKMHKKTRSLCACTYQWHIRDCKITDLSFAPDSEHDLAYFLHHKYGVLLLNQHTYNHIWDKIKTSKNWKQESHYKNLLKKFYAADINPKTYE